MVLENKGQQSGRGFWGQGQQPARQYNLPTRPKKPEVKKEAMNKGALGGKGHLTRLELRQKLRNQQLFKHGLKEKERIELEKEIFPQQKYGHYITKQELTQAIKDLKKEQYRNPKEKWNIEKKIKTLKEALGEK